MSMHILAINETKIDNLVSDNEIRISGYNIIRKDRNRNGGIVLVYIHESITFWNGVICVQTHWK